MIIDLDKKKIGLEDIERQFCQAVGNVLSVQDWAVIGWTISEWPDLVPGVFTVRSLGGVIADVVVDGVDKQIIQQTHTDVQGAMPLSATFFQIDKDIEDSIATGMMNIMGAGGHVIMVILKADTAANIPIHAVSPVSAADIVFSYTGKVIKNRWGRIS